MGFNVLLWMVQGLLALIFLFAGAESSWSCRSTQ